MTAALARRLRVIVVVGALLTVGDWSAGERISAAAAAPQRCGSSPAGNGTGYQPPQNRASLSRVTPRPGPEILYRPLARSPQLENTGPWRAAPIMVSGTRSYRQGEFVYQDFLYDDRALPYPDEPGRYAGNAADIVEVRLAPLSASLAVRVTYNSMLDPHAVASTIMLGNSATSRPLPHGAGAVSPGEIFVTVHGCEGDLVRAADGHKLRQRPVVTTDLRRRQVHVEVPYSAFDPRGKKDVRIGAAAGLWDEAAGRYLRPDPARPAFYNVAFRDYGRWVQNTWHDESQTSALAKGDLTPLAARVDFVKLAGRRRDDLVGKPGGVPKSGPMNRIHVSHFEFRQGRGVNTGGGILDYTCEPPQCEYTYSGRLQPYTVYVPSAPPRPRGYGLVVNLHGASSNHNHFESGPPGPYIANNTPEAELRPAGQEELDTWRTLAEAGRPSIMLAVNARGPTYFYHGLAAADVFEAWADAAGHYRLDPTFTIQSGSSMGGYGSYKFGAQFPDLFAGLFPNVGPGGPAIAHVPGAGTPTTLRGETAPMFASLRHVPVLATNGLNDPAVPLTTTTNNMRALQELGYRYDYWYFGSPYAIGHAEFRPYAADAYRELQRQAPRVVRDPGRVTYVVNPAMIERRYGLDSDHAYWVHGIVPRDGTALGSVDVVSHGRPQMEPVAEAPRVSVGTGLREMLPYTRTTRGWAPPPREAAPPAKRNALALVLRNVTAVTIDVDRARVGCDAQLSVDSDGPVTVTLQGARCRRVVDVSGPSATNLGGKP